MEQTLKSVIDLFEFNNSLFEGKIFSLSDDEADLRICDTVNPVKWVAGHLTSSRNHILNLVDIKRDFLYEEVFKGGYKESKQYPTMTELGDEFNDITDKLFTQLRNVSDDQLDKENLVLYPPN